ncbi:FkbM family methyltransferase [Natrarchaeobius halalkaliphilus]|nr:FkbM family methyltransferase [Natrarchaeobius halalkaliphilus]
MAATISKAITKVREDGLKRFIRNTPAYTHTELSRLVKSIQYIRWQRSGSHSVSVENINAEFNINDRADFHAVTYFKENERELARDLLTEVTPGDVVWDVGANIGIYTCLLKQLPTVEPIAFEPFPENKRRLKQNLRLNGIDATIVDAALSDRNTTVEFGLASNQNGNLGGSKILRTDEGNMVTVPARTGDSLEIPQPSVVKIDVEGAEQDVINGMKKTLRTSNCRIIYCEIHHSDSGSSIFEYGSTPSHLKQTLQDFDFTVTTLEKRNNQTQIKATK